MAIDSKDLLVAIKAYSRANPLPLDASEIHDSLDAAKTYAASAKAYPGQTIKVLQDGIYETYVLNPGDAGLTLSKIAADESQLKNYVQVVKALPESGQEQGVIYIDSALTGQIWTGSEWKVVFEQIELTNAEGEVSSVTVGEAISNISSELTSVQETVNVLNGDSATEGSIDYKIAEAIAGVDHLKRQVVAELPQEDIDENTIYMLPNGTADNDTYDEYMYINNKWEILGSTKVDLANYYTKDEADITFATIAALAGYALKTDIPQVPTNISAFDNDAGYITDTALTDYAKKDDIPSLDGYALKTDLNGLATESYVDSQVQAVHALIPSLDDYALKSEIPDLTNYATKDYVTDAVNNASLGGGDGSSIDLSIYALKTDLGELGNYTTVTDYVDAAVSALALNVVEF